MFDTLIENRRHQNTPQWKQRIRKWTENAPQGETSLELPWIRLMVTLLCKYYDVNITQEIKINWTKDFPLKCVSVK